MHSKKEVHNLFGLTVVDQRSLLGSMEAKSFASDVRGCGCCPPLSPYLARSYKKKEEIKLSHDKNKTRQNSLSIRYILKYVHQFVFS